MYRPRAPTAFYMMKVNLPQAHTEHSHTALLYKPRNKHNQGVTVHKAATLKRTNTPVLKCFVVTVTAFKPLCPYPAASMQACVDSKYFQLQPHTPSVSFSSFRETPQTMSRFTQELLSGNQVTDFIRSFNHRKSCLRHPSYNTNSSSSLRGRYTLNLFLVTCLNPTPLHHQA